VANVNLCAINHQTVAVEVGREDKNSFIKSFERVLFRSEERGDEVSAESFTKALENVRKVQMSGFAALQKG
jgi:hypothetical protein